MELFNATLPPTVTDAVPFAIIPVPLLDPHVVPEPPPVEPLIVKLFETVRVMPVLTERHPPRVLLVVLLPLIVRLFTVVLIPNVGMLPGTKFPIITSSLAVGTPEGDQLAAVFQSVDEDPFQVLVAAKAI